MTLLKPEHLQMKRIKFELMIKGWLKDNKITHQQAQQALAWYEKHNPSPPSFFDIYWQEYQDFIRETGRTHVDN